jgi:hypothetical protein
MKHITFLSALIGISFSALTAIPPSKDVRLYYLELYPKMNKEIKITYKQYCPEDKLNVQILEDKKLLPSTKGKKKVEVRVFSIIASMTPTCENIPVYATKTIKIPKDMKRMTHIYLIAEPKMKVDL